MINYAKVGYLVRPTFLEPLLGPLLRKLALKQWDKTKKPPPPDKIKYEIILDAAASLAAPVLIETGTFFGDTTQSVSHAFQKIYTIELSDFLVQKAKKRFMNNPQIEVLSGDSGIVLAHLLPAISSPVVFWLDAHYSRSVTAKGSKDSPIMEELKTIFDLCHVPSVILIDDARLFGHAKDYPSISEVAELLAQRRPNYHMIIHNDVIQIARIGALIP